MTSSSQDKQDQQKTNALGSVKVGLVLVYISAVPALWLIFMTLNKPKADLFGAYGMAMIPVAIAFLILSPASAAAGMILIRRSKSKLLRAVGWITALPTIFLLVFGAFAFIYDSRPITKYDPKDYQHFVGERLRDIESQLDTRHSVHSSGSSDGVSHKTLSLRGMSILANPDGIIFEVKNNRRD